MSGSYRRWGVGAAGLLALAAGAGAQSIADIATPKPVPGAVAADGTVRVPGFRLPPSAYLSAEAKAALPRTAADPDDMLVGILKAGKAGELRARSPQLVAPRVKHLTDLYPAKLRSAKLAGLDAVYVTPARPIPARNRGKILLDLPGGGFVMGVAGSTGMMESIPLSVLAQVEIVSVTYRQAPEAHFPAASEDIAAVYRELLKTHRPQDIGIFGCSAGGLLTAEAIAWFQKEKLPMPGAAGIFCASADARRMGDSRAWYRPLMGVPQPDVDAARTYFAAKDVSDPLASPILSPVILKRFPPTLIVTATRAQDLSGAVTTHRALKAQGVDADLLVWDGLGHAFFYNIDQPESKEAFGLMAAFFRKHLGLE